MKKQSFQKLFVKIFILGILCFNIVFSVEDVQKTETLQEIDRRLQKWAKDFNAKNREAVCELFAPDLVASYPGIGDRNYEQMCHTLTKAMTDSDKIFTYESPKIEQMILEGDLCVVRLIWNLKISDKKQGKAEFVQEKGLDIFKRQKDGSWKIMISYAYPLSNTFYKK